MMGNPHLEASERIAAAATTLPGDFLGRNVEVLYQILHELGRSHTAQLQLLGPLRRLDLDVWTEDLVSEVRAVRLNLEENSDAAILERWRTHCHNLRLLARQLVGEGRAVAEVQAMLGPLLDYDDAFVDELDRLVEPAVAAAQRVEHELVGHEGDGDALRRAREARDEFVEQYRGRLTEAKAALMAMNGAARELALRL
jgi:hypothetical protein